MKRNHSKNRIFPLLLAICLVVCALAIGASAESTAPVADPSPATYVANKNINSVVGILTYADQWSRQTGQQSINISQGSGVVIRDDGYIVTNNHVIEEGSSYQVLMPSGEKVDALLVGADSAMDLAVLKVESDAAAQLTPVEFGSSSELMVGSTAIAIGNPGGEVLANTVTSGIISALERTNISEEAGNTTRAVSYIQHCAPINNGNSGGGLFNYKGELIGINTLKYAGSAYSNVTFEGLGFAIPVETVVDVTNDLIEYGKVIRPALGVQVAAYNGPDEPLGSYPPASVCVYALNEGGAAEKAGLMKYDFIYKVNGVRVTTLQQMTSQLDLFNPGDTVEVTVIRYKNASQPQNNMSYYDYYFGGRGGNSESDDSQNVQAGEVNVSGGYEEITLSVVLEELD